MTDPALRVQRTYLVLTLFTTLAASFIWGINTLFLLDAGLDNAQAFAANAFFTVGQVLFEIPTGVVADTRGRRFSFLLGTATLLLATLLYLVMWEVRAGLVGWAHLVDPARPRFHVLLGRHRGVARRRARGDRASAARSRRSSRGPDRHRRRDAHRVRRSAASSPSRRTWACPYVLRAGLLGVTFVDRLRVHARHRVHAEPGASVGRRGQRRARGSIDGGLRNPPVRWLMLSAPFTAGVGIFAFYALQPYLLQLYGDPTPTASPASRPPSSPGRRSSAGSS